MTGAGAGRNGMARRVGRIWLVGVLLCMPACIDRPSPPLFQEGGAEGDAAAVIEVASSQYLDVVIYIGSLGAWHRLGTVTGLSVATRLTVPDAVGPLPGQYYLRVHAIGAPGDTDYYSGLIDLGPGDVVALRVASMLRQSSWSIKPKS